jgi:hypothetical protein
MIALSFTLTSTLRRYRAAASDAVQERVRRLLLRSTIAATRGDAG